MNNKVLIVDDHPAVRLALRLLLAGEGFDVVGETGDGAQALVLAEQFIPSTIVLDIGIETVDGLTVITEVVAKQLPVKIIVLTGLVSRHLEAYCRRLGAHGFVSKNQEMSELVFAMRAVRAGEEYFPSLAKESSIQSVLKCESERLDSLSVRESSVMRYLLLGLSNKEISSHLKLSSKTVSVYKARLLLKLNIGNLVELYALAKRNGLT